jgi:NAD(P)-dependent dehydrogenase (short-subunit alcohol dehydrogenase family)
VTGGARGLGLEFCRAFVQSGCTSLAIVDLKEEEATAAGEELIKQACGADSSLIALSLPQRC